MLGREYVGMGERHGGRRHALSSIALRRRPCRCGSVSISHVPMMNLVPSSIGSPLCKYRSSASPRSVAVGKMSALPVSGVTARFLNAERKNLVSPPRSGGCR